MAPRRPLLLLLGLAWGATAVEPPLSQACAEYEHLGQVTSTTQASAALASCCARHYYRIVAEAERAMLARLANATYFVKDTPFSWLKQRCLSLKEELFSGPCSLAKGLLRRPLTTCTMWPFTEQRRLQQLGVELLPKAQLSPERVEECRSRKYLLWTRHHEDFNAGHAHKQQTQLCARLEAQALNRTLIVDDFVGMIKVHTGKEFDAEVPYGAWYHAKNLRKSSPQGVMFWTEWRDGCSAAFDDSEYSEFPSTASHYELSTQAAAAAVVVRNFDFAPEEPKAYGYEVCHKRTAALGASGSALTTVHTQQKWGYGWHAPWISTLARTVMKRLRQASDGEPVCLHVRRGDKVGSSRHPNLDQETSPEAILDTLQPHVPAGAALYIATNEPNPDAFFAPLASRYEVFTLESLHLVNATQYEPSTLALVDYVVLSHCQRLVPTFRSERSRGFGDAAVSLSAYNKY